MTAGEIGCQRTGSDKTREEWVVSMWQNNIDLGEWLEVEFSRVMIRSPNWVRVQIGCWWVWDNEGKLY